MKQYLFCIWLMIVIGLFSMEIKSSSIIVAGRGSGGRLGDNVLLLAKAEYFSFITGLSLAYRNFPFFDQFAISRYEQVYTEELGKLYPEHVLVQDKSVFADQDYNQKMFEVDYFCRMRKNKRQVESYVGCGEYPFDWIKKKMMKYPEFGDRLRRDLQILNRENLPYIVRPAKDCITVAVTTRMGSGADDPFLYSEQFFDEQGIKSGLHNVHDGHADGGNPFKFVPQQFYVNQVKRLSELLQHRTMRIYFFVDKDGDFAREILKKWREALADYKNITIECASNGKKWNERVLDDLALISECDFLIRGCSHFSGIAQLIGRHKIIMGPDPVSAVWLDGKHLVFKKTFIYFQNVKEYKFEQYVFEDTEKNRLQKMVELYCNINNLKAEFPRKEGKQ